MIPPSFLLTFIIVHEILHHLLVGLKARILLTNGISELMNTWCDVTGFDIERSVTPNLTDGVYPLISERLHVLRFLLLDISGFCLVSLTSLSFHRVF